MKIAEHKYLELQPGVNDVSLYDASYGRLPLPLLERLTIKATVASDIQLVPPFEFEYQRVCYEEYIPTTNLDPYFTPDEPERTKVTVVANVGAHQVRRQASAVVSAQCQSNGH